MKKEIDLAKEAPLIVELLSPYFDLHTSGSCTDCELTQLFILSYLALRRPNNWCAGLSKTPLSGVSAIPEDVPSLTLGELTPSLQSHLNLAYLSKKLRHRDLDSTRGVRLVDLFNSLSLAGVKHNHDHFVNRCVVLWQLGRRPVRLLAYIPSPQEVLQQQARGERVVTLFRREDELSRAHTSLLTYMSGAREHSRDPLEFLLHDLRHMEHFASEDAHDEQVGFFFAFSRINGGKLKRYFLDILSYEKSLWFELEYVISDMNCHCAHLLRYLHAKWFAAFVSRHAAPAAPSSSSSSSSSTPAAPLVHCEDPSLLERLHSEWRDIVSQLFVCECFAMRDDEACDAACALNDVSLHKMSDLPLSDWLRIREWFILLGQRRRQECLCPSSTTSSCS